MLSKCLTAQTSESDWGAMLQIQGLTFFLVKCDHVFQLDPGKLCCNTGRSCLSIHPHAMAAYFSCLHIDTTPATTEIVPNLLCQCDSSTARAALCTSPLQKMSQKLIFKLKVWSYHYKNNSAQADMRCAVHAFNLLLTALLATQLDIRPFEIAPRWVEVNV